MWPLGAYVIARWSDSKGNRKPFLLAFLVIFSACSILSGLAQSFPMLLISRAIMDAVEGPFLPVCLAIMAVESSPNRRGVNAGIMQNFFAALLGQSLAPRLLPIIAEEYGWRAAFFVSGVHSPLFMGVIPGESIPRKYAATAMGLVVCVGEVLGGSGLVALAGKIAEPATQFLDTHARIRQRSAAVRRKFLILLMVARE